MRRRDFSCGIGAAIIAATVRAQAAPAPKMPTIGFLGTSRPATWAPWVSAFVSRLAELGWSEGRTLRIEYRWAEGHPDQFAKFGAEFARLNVNVILTSGTAVLALKQITTTIPIVCAVAVDLLGTGDVSSLARPGGNITGLSVQGPELAGKRAELLREVIPNLQRLGALADAGYSASLAEITGLTAVAQRLAIEIVPIRVRRAEEITAALDAARDSVDGLYVTGGALMATNRALIAKAAIASKLATCFNANNFVQAGGLMSYGPDFIDLFRRAAEMTDKILRGASPADIPVEQPAKFHLAINLETARSLRVSIAPTLLARADEVIE